MENGPGGGIPFGYKSVGKRLVLDEIKAPHMKRALEAYAVGASKKRVIEKINAAGFRNRNGKPFGPSAFQQAFKSDIYLGTLRWGDIVVENAFPALIDRATFDKIQERITANRRSGGKANAKIEHLLSGKVFCGPCGSTVIGMGGTSSQGNSFYYYSCRGRRDFRQIFSRREASFCTRADTSAASVGTVFGHIHHTP